MSYDRIRVATIGCMWLPSRAARPRDEGRPAREPGQAGGPDPRPRAAGPGGPVPLARGSPADGRPDRRAGGREPAATPVDGRGPEPGLATPGPAPEIAPSESV